MDKRLESETLLILKKILLILFFIPYSLFAQEISSPSFEESINQDIYKHQSVDFQSFAKTQDGYWLFEPNNPRRDSAHVIIFLHGYGGYNPMIYGKWIKHLVKQGNIVIYPRYQKNLRKPKPDVFAANTAKAIRDAKEELEKENHTKPIWKHLTFVGHSYGGVISSDLAINFKKYNIPQPKSIMICSPGTAWLKLGRLESYEAMPAETKLVITVSDDDLTTGDEFGLLVFNTAIKTKNRVLYRQFADRYGKPAITAGHNQSYCLDKEFDSGVRNYTAIKALKVSRLDAMDFNGYWRLFDALIDCERNGTNCDFILGRKGEFNLGKWSDGTEMKAFEIKMPNSN